MKDLYLQGFGTKMLASSKSVNKIPEEYLSVAQNARIYDGGIGPARGKRILTTSTLGTENRGGFMLNGKLYQITNSKIYEINLTEGTQTEIDDIGYDARVDVLTYKFPKGDFISDASETKVYSESPSQRFRYKYNEEDKAIEVYGGPGYTELRTGSGFTYDNRGEALPAVRIIKATTDGYSNRGKGFDDGLGVVLLDGQYIKAYCNNGGNTTISFEIGHYASEEKAIIASDGRDLKIFDGKTVSDVSVSNTGILEYTRGYSFLAEANILKTSRPITITNPEYAYDFTGTGSQQLIYRDTIRGLLGNKKGIYIFTDSTVEYIGSNGLQNIAGSATFISSPLGDGGVPMNNKLIAGSGDKVFYITKNKEIKTVNYIAGISDPSLGEISTRPIVSINEFMKNIDSEQPDGYAFENKNDNTIQFHVRENNYLYPNICIVYDMINDTWAVDKGKNYNYIVENSDTYYGFSGINDAIYLDDTGFSMAGSPILFKIATHYMNQGNLYQKLYGGFLIAGGIGVFTSLFIKVLIDGGSVFSDNISGSGDISDDLGELGGGEIGGPLGGDLTYNTELQRFDRVADEGRILLHGNKIKIEISSDSDIQDFLIDTLGVRAEQTQHIDVSDKF